MQVKNKIKTKLVSFTAWYLHHQPTNSQTLFQSTFFFVKKKNAKNKNIWQKIVKKREKIFWWADVGNQVMVLVMGMVIYLSLFLIRAKTNIKKTNLIFIFHLVVFFSIILPGGVFKAAGLLNGLMLNT